jgi:DNA topoisomerase-1
MAQRVGWRREGSKWRFRYVDADGRGITDEDKLERIRALAIPPAWNRYANTSRTFGITTLRKSHVSVRGARISFRYRGKHRIMIHSAIVDSELAAAMKELLAQPGARLFQFETDGARCNLDQRRLNNYIRTYLGEEFTAKDFRTWGGTLTAAVELARHAPPETDAEAKRRLANVMRKVGEKLGNTPAIARSSYVSPAVVEQYLDGRTIEDFRPRHLRVIRAREIDLDHEEQATLSLLRSWRIRAARRAA